MYCLDMMIKNILIVACIFSSCARAPEHVRKCDEVGKEFAEKMQREEGFSLLGLGGVYGKTTIDQLYIDFEVNKEVSIEEGRELLQKAAKKFIDHINAKEGFSKYLTNFPVSSKEISVSIGFVDKSRIPRNEIAQVDLYNEEFSFSTYSKEENRYISIQKEVCFLFP